MVAYAYILLGIVCMICNVPSQSLDECTNLTTMCPIFARWLKRDKLYKCPGRRSYVCLMSDDKTLREGCIFNSLIQAGTVGCPYTKRCDNLTQQPVLVDPNNYHPCPPDHDGCPPRNHSGYSILDVHKYPMCQGRNISTKRTTSLDRVIDVPMPIPPNRRTRDEGNATTIILIILGIFVFILLCVVVIVIKKFRGRVNLKLMKPQGTRILLCLPELSRAISETIRDLNNRLFVRNSEGLPKVHCVSLEANNHSNSRLLEDNSGGNT